MIGLRKTYSFVSESTPRGDSYGSVEHIFRKSSKILTFSVIYSYFCLTFSFRKSKHETETALRQALQDKVMAQEELHDKIEALEEHVDR